MAVLTASKRRKVRNIQAKKIANYAVATGEVIYHGALCNVNTTTGRLVAADNVAGQRFAGMAEEQATGNTAGTVTCDVSYGQEALINASSVLTVAYVGSNAAVFTDDDVTTASNAGTAGVQVLCGEVVQIEGGDAWVSLRNYAHRNV